MQYFAKRNRKSQIEFIYDYLKGFYSIFQELELNMRLQSLTAFIDTPNWKFHVFSVIYGQILPQFLNTPVKHDNIFFLAPQNNQHIEKLWKKDIRRVFLSVLSVVGDKKRNFTNSIFPLNSILILSP